MNTGLRTSYRAHNYGKTDFITEKYIGNSIVVHQFIIIFPNSQRKHDLETGCRLNLI